MQLGDIVKTPVIVSGDKWWWTEKVGIIIRDAIPAVGPNGEWTQCWHVLIGTRTANLREENLELLSESR